MVQFRSSLLKTACLVRDSVHRALSTDADVNVVGVAEDYDSAVELIEKHHPTLLFTDVRMPPTSTDEGIRLARWMRTAHPDIGVIVLVAIRGSPLRDGVAGRRNGGPRLSAEGTRFAFRPAQRGGAPSRRRWDGAGSAGGRGAARSAELCRDAQPVDPQRTRGARRTGHRAQQPHGGATACADSAGGGKAHQFHLRQARLDRRRLR